VVSATGEKGNWKSEKDDEDEAIHAVAIVAGEMSDSSTLCQLAA